MRTSKTTWSLVSLAATLATAAVVFTIWQELWPAVIAGALIGGAVAALRTPAHAQVSWAAALVWSVATVIAAICGFLAYNTWASIWLAFVLAAVVAGIAGALLSILTWIANPTPVDLDSMLGGPDDVWWQLRETQAWRRLSDWVDRRTTARTRSRAHSAR
jgi:hypothetical protein